MDIANEIAKALTDYTTEVVEEIEEIAEKVAEETVNTLKVTSPQGKRSRYGKGWRSKKDGKGYIIYNATDAGLTHLVEKGHAKRNGGRTKAQNHIQNAEQTAIKDFENKIERAIKR
ncbi:HK97 gp10 family phage protein [Pseudolactococcus carnosus]|uniref:HK97 gp10 family phage protein n=1 Tax=Pseudolactococcus carnosus TaxID=2749961 RepID=A0ABT0AQX6_9LACT|nr:HK97 gp10 family phage protein [Lactococcus carnosus]MCJ1989029.1 HK97 gp10 family phage protein [Lactococcus carnosus]